MIRVRVREIYIGDFSNISAIFRLYRFTDKKRQKEEAVSTQPLPSILEAPPEQ
ncbi:hypothetical protein BK749_15225 [Bacillus thuringiensis serovar vazensis]|uniref:Uncharacterized protein n=1 Tax=Bacillus thuringiensis serovar vazensis TaxID=180867 RepID=A0A243CVJ2_BACTU|nr:hypothetical protein BK749_15225 [Bacillus thuringiensis serovar vazensis]